MSNPQKSHRRVTNVVAVDIGWVCVALTVDRCAKHFGCNDFDTLKLEYPELVTCARALEVGQIDRTEFVNTFAEHLDLGQDAIEPAFCSLIGDEIPGMGGVIARMLDMKLRPVFFSDISTVHYQHVREKLSFADMIPDAVVSYEAGELKPHEAMYRMMEERFCNGGVPILYLDDKPGNIAGGRCRGWRGYQVGTVAGIHKALDGLASTT